jgi:multidrug resistance protein
MMEPLIIGPLSEVYGRLIMYHICNVVFTVFTTLCASVHNFRTLAILRFLAGCGGASAFTLGPATVADLVPFEKRNGMYAILGTAYNLGPAVSPIIGDYIHHSMGWRWIFWITGIAGGVCTVATLVLSESYEPVVLRRKVQRLRKETGNPNLHSVRDTNGSVPSSRILVRAMLRPLRMLLLLPNVFLVSLLTAVGYGYMYVLYTTIPSVFLVDPFWHTRNIGLAYLATGFGCVLGMVIGGPLSDFIVKRRLACRDTRPENRLIPMIYFWPLVSIGLIVFGWTAEKQVAWYWPQLGTAIFGVSAMSAIVSIRSPGRWTDIDMLLAILRHVCRRCIHRARSLRSGSDDSPALSVRRSVTPVRA